MQAARGKDQGGVGDDVTQLALSQIASWRPGIGDPSAYGWAIAGGYVLATILCVWACRSVGSLPKTDRLRLCPLLLTTGTIMLLLALNKQLDLQNARTDVGQSLARKHGWYDHRRVVQRIFVIALALAAVCGIAGGIALLRNHLKQAGLLLLGLVVTAAFVLVRAASFHHVNDLLATSVAGLPLTSICETLGIALICIGCIQMIVAAKHPRPNP